MCLILFLCPRRLQVCPPCLHVHVVFHGLSCLMAGPFYVLDAVFSVGIPRSSPSIDVPDVGELPDGFGIGPEFVVVVASCSHPVVEVH